MYYTHGMFVIDSSNIYIALNFLTQNYIIKKAKL